MSEALSAADIQAKVITIVRDYLPLSDRKSRSFIEANIGEPIMAFFQMPTRSFNDVLDEFEFEFSIVAPDDVQQAELVQTNRFLFFKTEKRINPFQLAVPDISISTLCEIAAAGRWPMDFYVVKVVS